MMRPLAIIVILAAAALPACAGSSGGGEGDSSLPATLASCGEGSLFSAMPMADADIWYIAPLGNLNPTGHTFPTDHIYLYMPQDPQDETKTISATVFAPARIWIGKVTAQENQTAGYTDYSIDFYPCREAKVTYGHIQELSSDLAAQIGTWGDAGCETYATGGTNYRSCSKTVEIELAAGTAMGTAGGRTGQFALDIWFYDSRTAALAYANPSRLWSSEDGLDPLHIACPIDAFSDSLRSSLEAKLGLPDARRTVEPICGEVMQDVAGTVQGKWYYAPDAGGTSEDPHLALVHDNFDPTKGAFSVGTSVTAIADRVMFFAPQHTGQVNREFSEVTADGNISCYDSFSGDAPANTIVLLQLTSNTALTIEAQTAVSCGAGPWAFTGGAIAFER